MNDEIKGREGFADAAAEYIGIVLDCLDDGRRHLFTIERPKQLLELNIFATDSKLACCLEILRFATYWKSIRSWSEVSMMRPGRGGMARGNCKSCVSRR
jgi:hypothetical protein